MGLKQRFKHTYIHTHTMTDLAKLHKLTVFSQILILKLSKPRDLRTMLLNRYPLKLNEMPQTITALIRGVEELLPDIKRIIENTMAHITAEEEAAVNEVMQLLNLTLLRRILLQPDRNQNTEFVSWNNF